ncbi:MAG: hypothetical protein J7K95_01955, partial [Thermoplasmata archaeon]|nr:hypothetical protein [Thermoplasmata archaeon]
MIKTDSDGNIEWDKKFGGFSSCDIGYCVQQTSDNGFILTCKCSSGLWVIKTDGLGNKQWDKKFENYDGELSVIHQTIDGGYIITGNCNGDAGLIKIDENGNIEWEKTFGGSSSDSACSIKQTQDGGYILTGSTNSYGAGGADLWIIRTDVNGAELWNITYGENKNEVGVSIIELEENEYVVLGNKNVGSYTYDSDIWLIKLKEIQEPPEKYFFNIYMKTNVKPMELVEVTAEIIKNNQPISGLSPTASIYNDIGDIISSFDLIESSNGIYSGNFISPEKIGTYKIKITAESYTTGKIFHVIKSYAGKIIAERIGEQKIFYKYNLETEEDANANLLVNKDELYFLFHVEIEKNDGGRLLLDKNPVNAEIKIDGKHIGEGKCLKSGYYEFKPDEEIFGEEGTYKINVTFSRDEYKPCSIEFPIKIRELKIFFGSSIDPKNREAVKSLQDVTDDYNIQEDKYSFLPKGESATLHLYMNLEGEAENPRVVLGLSPYWISSDYTNSLSEDVAFEINVKNGLPYIIAKKYGHCLLGESKTIDIMDEIYKPLNKMYVYVIFSDENQDKHRAIIKFLPKDGEKFLFPYSNEENPSMDTGYLLWAVKTGTEIGAPASEFFEFSNYLAYAFETIEMAKFAMEIDKGSLNIHDFPKIFDMVSYVYSSASCIGDILGLPLFNPIIGAAFGTYCFMASLLVKQGILFYDYFNWQMECSKFWEYGGAQFREYAKKAKDSEKEMENSIMNSHLISYYKENEKWDLCFPCLKKGMNKFIVINVGLKPIKIAAHMQVIQNPTSWIGETGGGTVEREKYWFSTIDPGFQDSHEFEGECKCSSIGNGYILDIFVSHEGIVEHSGWSKYGILVTNLSFYKKEGSGYEICTCFDRNENIYLGFDASSNAFARYSFEDKNANIKVVLKERKSGETYQYMKQSWWGGTYTDRPDILIELNNLPAGTYELCYFEIKTSTDKILYVYDRSKMQDIDSPWWFTILPSPIRSSIQIIPIDSFYIYASVEPYYPSITINSTIFKP